MMRWKKELIVALGLLTTVTITGMNSVTAHAANTYHRGKTTTIKAKAYYSTSKTGKTYRLSGSAKRTKRTASHALKSALKTTWIASKQTTLTRSGKTATYYYVKNAKTKASGWVLRSQLKAGKNYQSSAVKTTTATAYQQKSAHVGKLYPISGSNQAIKFGKGTALKSAVTYTKTKQRTIYKAGKGTQYAYVTAGKTHGWVASTYLKRKSNVGQTVKGSTTNGVTSYTAKGNVLAGYLSRDYSTVALGDYTMGKVNYAYDSDYQKMTTFQTAMHTLPLSKSTGDAASRYHFKTAIYLPIDYKGFNRKAILGNPQSAAFSKDDRYLYVMYVDNQQASDANQSGWVIRYDWTALTKLVNAKGSTMDMVRRATNHYYKGTQTATDKKVLKCMKVGPEFKSGHAQSLALNPKNNQLWFVKSYKSQTAVVERLSTSTLKPNAAVSFTMNATVHMGSTLTFDSAGHAYFWTQTQSAWPTAPLNSVKLYQGTISTSKVRFKLIMQGLRKVPGQTLQSISYNTQNNRLYLVSDESIFSVPVNKLGHLATSDVGCSNFSGRREFEALVWKHQSNAGYLLTNKGPELMQLVYQ
ncbi:hypothetical protein [Lactiplantibacillus carotarum]|uniref:hypothetical protein n=1 Tax=Lactiplantibacillus carotarum TaxID=2993456 RepID=UPI00298F0185|nr:hypothetical protein [Lactiplantibacillus carotarum]